MGRGWRLGAGAAPGGGSESLRDTEQKTVGPSRVKIREIVGGWVPMNLLQNDSDCLTDSYHKSGNIDLSRFFIRRCIEAIF